MKPFVLQQVLELSRKVKELQIFMSQPTSQFVFISVLVLASTCLVKMADGQRCYRNQCGIRYQPVVPNVSSQVICQYQTIYNNYWQAMPNGQPAPAGSNAEATNNVAIAQDTLMSVIHQSFAKLIQTLENRIEISMYPPEIKLDVSKEFKEIINRMLPENQDKKKHHILQLSDSTENSLVQIAKAMSKPTAIDVDVTVQGNIQEPVPTGKLKLYHGRLKDGCVDIDLTKPLNEIVQQLEQQLQECGLGASKQKGRVPLSTDGAEDALRFINPIPLTLTAVMSLAMQERSPDPQNGTEESQRTVEPITSTTPDKQPEAQGDQKSKLDLSDFEQRMSELLEYMDNESRRQSKLTLATEVQLLELKKLISDQIRIANAINNAQAREQNGLTADRGKLASELNDLIKERGAMARQTKQMADQFDEIDNLKKELESLLLKDPGSKAFAQVQSSLMKYAVVVLATAAFTFFLLAILTLVSDSWGRGAAFRGFGRGFIPVETKYPIWICAALVCILLGWLCLAHMKNFVGPNEVVVFVEPVCISIALISVVAISLFVIWPIWSQ